MATPDWTIGIVEAMAKALDPSAWVPSSYEELDVRLANRREVALTKAQSALAAALPMILEQAAAECDILMLSARAGHESIMSSIDGTPLSAALAAGGAEMAKGCAARIRTLTTSFDKAREP